MPELITSKSNSTLQLRDVTHNVSISFPCCPSFSCSDNFAVSYRIIF